MAARMRLFTPRINVCYDANAIVLTDTDFVAFNPENASWNVVSGI